MTRLQPPRKFDLLPVLSLAIAVMGGALMAGADAFAPATQDGVLIGLSFTLVAIFGLIWLLGIRYPDVGWMVVVVALSELSALLRLGNGETYVSASQIVRFALMLALGAFLMTFYRIRFRPARLETAFLLVTAGFGAARIWLPENFRQLARLDLDLASYLGAVILAYAAVHGLLTLKPLPAKRRRYVILIVFTAIVGAVLYLLDGKVGALTSPDPAVRALRTLRLDLACVVAFAMFVVADLVIFHRNYYRDKAQRIVAREQGALSGPGGASRTALERAMPTERRGRFGGFAFEFHFEIGKTPGGDWIFSWEQGSEKRFLTGEVRAHGVAPGMTVAAVLAALDECKASGLSLAKTAALLNERLIDLFAGQVTTTLLAISTDLDGTIELFNCGGPGFFVVSRDGCRHYPLGSSPVGADGGYEPAGCPIPLDDGDLLFCGNAGLFEDGAIEQVLEHFEDDMDFRLETTYVRSAVLNARGSGRSALVVRAGKPEDQTLFVLQKHAS